jgi:hypothetical protein
MGVTTRSKRSEGSSIRQRWQARRGRGAQHPGAAPTVVGSLTATAATASAGPVPAATAKPQTRRQPRGGAPLDHALYTCHCGFVFEAPVSTSVDCPHCGSYQAW